MSQQRPGSVTGAIWLLVALVALTGVTALLTVVFKDELIDAWASGRADAGSVEPPAFVPVAIVLFVVIALLAGVLVMFFRDGHNWARLSLTGLVAFMAIATLAGLRANPPALFLVMAVAALVVDLALLLCLWHKDTRTYIHGGSIESGARS
jgi:hypothetical protein